MQTIPVYTLPELQSIFSDYVKENKFERSPQNLYDPINYIIDLGGKQLRSALLLMSCNLFDQEVGDALPAAYAIELFHNFSLMHDDIMDNAPLRRGQDSVHIKYDTNAAILSGDAMLVLAYQYLAKSPPSILPALFPIFNKTALEVCEGQQYDMNFETAKVVSIEEYLLMIELKTAALLGGAMKIGALIGGAFSNEAEAIEKFARNLGIAFQLQDDILDTFGDPKKFGKKVGGDIVQNKKTYLVLKTLELASKEDKKTLKKLMSSTPKKEKEKIEAVKALFEKYNIRTVAEAKKQAYQNLAFNYLNEIGIEAIYKKPLFDFATALFNREV